jgi:hypothetical protein
MKKSEKQVIALSCIILVGGLAAWYLTNPVGAYLFAIEMTFNGYEPSFEPSVFLKQIPRYQTFQQSYVQKQPTLELFGIENVLIDVNITVLNDQGAVWIHQRFLVDSLAEQKLVSQRQYDPAARTQSVTLNLDFYMLINRTLPDPAIERDWHGSWNLNIPT